MTHVLIVGFSARMVADSAVLAGFKVTTVDAFSDLDLHPSVHVVSWPYADGVAFDAVPAAKAAVGTPGESAVYLSNFENHPEAVGLLARSHTLWGNPPSVLRLVRDPTRVAEVFRRHGLPAPEVATGIGPLTATAAPSGWLLKPYSSGGGHGVRRWAGEALPAGSYLQRRVEGVAASCAFVAAGGSAVPLGVSRQLVGARAFGATAYRYCGSILPAAGDPLLGRDNAVVDAAETIARTAAKQFDLVGLNGVDFITRDGTASPVEINPRWCASMELIERAYGVSMFGVHAAACSAGTLPRFDVRLARRRVPAVGKAIVFARSNVTVGDTRAWISDPSVRDVPRPGQEIPAGHPICTVFAEAPSGAMCYDALVRRAARVYEELG